MPKRAPDTDIVDPVRSRLAGDVAGPVPPRPAPRPAAEDRAGQGSEPEPPPVRRLAPRPAARDRLTVARKVMFTSEEADRNIETTESLSAAFGNHVTYSQVTRAMWSLLAGSEDALQANARRATRLTFPSKGDHPAMAEYEQALVDFLLTALRRA